jgi:hypothetical protein
MATLVGGVIVLFYDPTRSLILKLVNYNTYVRFAACAILIAGSLIKIVYGITKKRKFYAKYDKKHRSKVQERIPINSNGSSKTLIPVRQKEYRK